MQKIRLLLEAHLLRLLVLAILLGTAVPQCAAQQKLPARLTHINQGNQLPQEVTVEASARLRAQEHYVRRYPFGIKFDEAEPQQYFYLVPANFGGTIFTAISSFIAWPVSAAWNAYHGHKTRRDMIPPVHWAANTIGLAGAYLIGSPFWVLEQIFWEFPVWLSGSRESKTADTEADGSYLIGNSI